MSAVCAISIICAWFYTAPALIFIATFFLKNLKDIDWEDVSEYTPAVLAAIIMPLTYSIAYGIALGFIAYTPIKLLTGRSDALNGGVCTCLSFCGLFPCLG